MRSFHLKLVLAMLLSAAGACASKLKPKGDDKPDAGAASDAGDTDRDAVLDGGIPVRTGKFKTSEDKGSLLTSVDATDQYGWQQFDLDTGQSSTDDAAWDLGFQRFKIHTNGGATGSGGVFVVQLKGQSYDALEKAPDMGFAADRPDSVGDAGDADSDPDNVFNSDTDDWYDYNVNTHELSPMDITYVIASTDKRFYKLKIEAYYDNAGTPAQIKFRWKAIEAPDSGFPPDAGATADN
jgi:hypothetical protein